MRLFKRNVFQHSGYCPICEKTVKFRAKEKWFRDHLLCSSCGSIPRERALFKIITDYFPNYRELSIHESSPGGQACSMKLHLECSRYTTSHYYPNIFPGQLDPLSGCRCENLEKLTYSDNSFDLFITQDVMEHILDPGKAFKEIARVLKPGGAHIFTVPLVNKVLNSECRAYRNERGDIVYNHEPEYHANPIDKKGSLVTMDWGYDIANYIIEVSKMPTIIIMIDNIDLGIHAEYIDVLVSCKR